MRKLLYICSLVSLLSFSTVAQSFTHQIIGRNSGVDTLWDGTVIRIFGFANFLGSPIKIPGPTIEANEGDSVIIKFWNVSQGAPHTIHPHGLDVDQANDGVPHLSQSVGHMQQFYYRFKAPHAGTYLYHCHVASSIHVQAGMYGMVIIRPSNGSKTLTWNGGYTYDTERAWLMSEVDTVWHNDSILNHPYDTAQVKQIHVPDYNPQYFLINGLSENELNDPSVEINASKGEKLYIRLANIGFQGNRVIFPVSLNAQVIASDGRPLPSAVSSDTVWVYPGERYGVLLSPNTNITDSVRIDYVNMNTMQTESSQYINATVSGTFSIEEERFALRSINLMPNPAADNFSLQFTSEKDQVVSIELLDIAGRIVKSFVNGVKVMSEQNVVYNYTLESISSGIYFVQINTEQGSIQRKLIVNHN